jgi:Leu/Phe-tRNA-protein transferase
MSNAAKEWEAEFCDAFRAYFKECADEAGQSYDEWIEEAYRGQF